MTRKHFEAIAYKMSWSKPEGKKAASYKQWLKDCKAMAEVCSQFNYNFDKERFLKACGV